MKICSCCATHEAIYKNIQPRADIENVLYVCRYCYELLCRREVTMKEENNPNSVVLMNVDGIRKLILEDNDSWQKYKKEIDEMYDKLQELA